MYLPLKLRFLTPGVMFHSMEQSPSWEANRFSNSQEIRRILWNPKDNYRVAKRSPPVPIPSQISPVHDAHSTSSHLRRVLPSGLFPPVFPTRTLYKPLPSPIHAICPAHLILLGLITRTITGEENSSLSSTLCSFLHSAVTSSLLGPNILLSALFSNIFILRFSLNLSDNVSHS